MKYLNGTGVGYLWTKIKSVFLAKASQSTSNLDTLYTTGRYYFTNTATGRPFDNGIVDVVVGGNGSDTYNGTSNWLWHHAFSTDGQRAFRYKIGNGAWSKWNYDTNYDMTSFTNGEDLLAWVNALKAPASRAVAGTNFPTNLPVNAEGIIEVLFIGGPDRKMVIFTPYGDYKGIQYNRTVWNNGWVTGWMYNIHSGGGQTISGDLTIAFPNAVKARHVDGANNDDLYLNYNNPSKQVNIYSGGTSGIAIHTGNYNTPNSGWGIHKTAFTTTDPGVGSALDVGAILIVYE